MERLELAEQIQTLRREREHTGIFLDFDGTLAPIVEDREAAAIVPEAPEILSSLSRLYKLVAFISGRGAADLYPRVGADGPRYLGLYGAEEMTPEGLVQSPMAGRWRQTAKTLAGQAAEVIRANDLAGCDVENKDLAVSLHYRNSGLPEPPPPLAAWARDAASRTGFTLGVGRMVLELKPPSVSKASAFQRLAVQAQVQNALVAGDDAADVEMMRRAAHLIPGLLLRVGVVSTEAPAGMLEVTDLQVKSPAEVVELLERLL
ncbi:MAG TPA: trehalose-phosphatase [Actinomycetota bacterium]|nr:trehalose-phosphatase [Actinomycetota bacterium]